MDPDPWADAPQAASTTASTPFAAATSSSKPSRSTPRRIIAQPTRLQAVEDDPLGPLGAPAAGKDAADLPPGVELPPALPSKEQLPLRTTLPAAPGGTTATRRTGSTHHHRLDDDDDEGFNRPSGPRQPPPVQAALASPVRSNMQPSVSIEQAAKPSFNITVGDPSKVGDLTSSHIVYSVRTRVGRPCERVGDDKPGQELLTDGTRPRRKPTGNPNSK